MPKVSFLSSRIDRYEEQIYGQLDFSCSWLCRTDAINEGVGQIIGATPLLKTGALLVELSFVLVVLGFVTLLLCTKVMEK
jgi:hypothetical protein